MDEVYIKMCREATEIQEGWEPKPGDLIYNPMPSIHADYNVDLLVIIMEKDCEHCINQKEWIIKRILLTEDLTYYGKAQVESEIPLEQRFKWLPRQEDLQKIYKEQKELSFDCCYVQFKRWDAFRYQHEEFEHGLPYFEIFETGDWNILWLCFVMETCFNKQWNTETQTWETTQ